MFWTLSPIIKFSTWIVEEKALAPIVLTLFPISEILKLGQALKADSPIVIKEFGNLEEFNPKSAPAKPDLSIVSILSINSKYCNVVAPAKA
jgi:hypothetical protein